MAQGFLIACQSGAVPVATTSLAGNSLMCPKINNVADPMVIVEPTDFQSLVDLLQFDSGICAQLIGGCLVIFLLGFAGGKVARIISRR